MVERTENDFDRFMSFLLGTGISFQLESNELYNWIIINNNPIKDRLDGRPISVWYDKLKNSTLDMIEKDNFYHFIKVKFDKSYDSKKKIIDIKFDRIVIEADYH